MRKQPCRARIGMRCAESDVPSSPFPRYYSRLSSPVGRAKIARTGNKRWDDEAWPSCCSRLTLLSALGPDSGQSSGELRELGEACSCGHRRLRLAGHVRTYLISNTLCTALGSPNTLLPRTVHLNRRPGCVLTWDPVCGLVDALSRCRCTPRCRKVGVFSISHNVLSSPSQDARHSPFECASDPPRSSSESPGNSFVSWRGPSSIMINALRPRNTTTAPSLFSTSKPNSVSQFPRVPRRDRGCLDRIVHPVLCPTGRHHVRQPFCRVHVEILVFIFYQSPRSRSNNPPSSEKQIFLCSL